MNIQIQHQQLNVEHIDVLDISASSNLQVGDNDRVLLYSSLQQPPENIQCGPFPMPYYPNQPFSNQPYPNQPYSIELPFAQSFVARMMAKQLNDTAPRATTLNKGKE